MRDSTIQLSVSSLVSTIGTTLLVVGAMFSVGCKFSPDDRSRIIALDNLSAEQCVRFEGSAENHLVGLNAVGVGDVNGDGYDDFLIATDDVFDATTAGAVYLVFGAPSFASPLTLSSLSSVNAIRITNNDGNYYMGQTLSPAGDVNNDGFADFIISCRQSSYLIFGGPTLSAVATDGHFDLATEFSPDTGIVVFDTNTIVSIGDFNNDGHTDFAFGSTTTAAVYIVFGGPLLLSGVVNGVFSPDSVLVSGHGFLITEFADTTLRCAAAGDVNNDGFADFIIGSPWESPFGRVQAGAAWIVFGSATPPVTVLDINQAAASVAVMIAGTKANERYGSSVSGGGDVDGDGYADILIGPDNSSVEVSDLGIAIIFGDSHLTSAGVIDLATLNSPVGCWITGDLTSASSAPNACAIVGDYNGDGIADLAVVASYDTRSSVGCRIHLVLGNPYLKMMGSFSVGAIDTVPYRWRFDTAPPTPSNATTGSAHAGDINGDGRPDFLIAEPTAQIGSHSSVGRVYLIFGH